MSDAREQLPWYLLLAIAALTGGIIIGRAGVGSEVIQDCKAIGKLNIRNTAIACSVIKPDGN